MTLPSTGSATGPLSEDGSLQIDVDRDFIADAPADPLAPQLAVATFRRRTNDGVLNVERATGSFELHTLRTPLRAIVSGLPTWP